MGDDDYHGCEPTYEELKLKDLPDKKESYKVASLPTRN